MILGVINQTVDEHFTVIDKNGNPIIGLDSTSISVNIYNPSGVDVTSVVSSSFSELGNGYYKYTFTPYVEGTWYVSIKHPVYFPWGKSDDVQVYSNDISDIYNNVVKTLGLVHHNFYIDNAVYDEHGNMIGARVRIYSDSASVGTDLNVIETYKIESDGTQCGQFSYWKQVKL